MLEVIDLFIHNKIEESFFIGAEVYVEKKGNLIYHQVFGKSSLKPVHMPLQKDMLYDLASLTKVVTSTILLKLIEEGKCSLDTKVTQYFQTFDKVTDKMTLRHLLTHTSGLPAWYPFYAKKASQNDYIEDVLDILKPLTIIPDEKTEYSDLNFILLGKIIEKIEQKSLDQVVQNKLVKPLHMETLQYNPSHHLMDLIVPTEYGNHIERKMVRDYKLYYDGWREEVIKGQVNDGNAYYYLKGVSGHAGLFSNIGDIAKLARVYLGSHYLSENMVKQSYKNYTSKGPEGRGLGWVIDDQLKGFGHTGFTGTSLWIVPEEELFIILLTSRLHQNEVKNIQPVRKELYSLILNHLA